MLESYLIEEIKEVKKLQAMNHDMLDFLRTQVAWLLEYCERNNIPLPDLSKAKLFFKTSGDILERNIQLKINNGIQQREIQQNHNK